MLFAGYSRGQELLAIRFDQIEKNLLRQNAVAGGAGS